MSHKTPQTMTPARANELAADFLAARYTWAGGLDLTMTAPPPPAGQPAPSGPPQGQPPAHVPSPPAPAVPAALPRPDGVSEAEWAALGDPGKAAIVRERAARQTAEQTLAAERAVRAATPPKPGPPQPPAPAGPQDPNDLAGIVQRAVAAAVAPFQEAQAQRDADTAAGAIRDAVVSAAALRMHDAADALTQIDLTTVTDGTGRPDPTKITAALDALLTSKPYLGRVVDTRLQAPPGSLVGSNGAFMPSLDDRTKATLARMQASAGVKFADSPQA